MNPPATNFEHILGSSCVTLFSDITKLYELEECNTLKVAFALKKPSLIPSNIAKISPQHALSKCYSSIVFLFDIRVKQFP